MKRRGLPRQNTQRRLLDFFINTASHVNFLCPCCPEAYGGFCVKKHKREKPQLCQVGMEIHRQLRLLDFSEAKLEGGVSQIPEANHQKQQQMEFRLALMALLVQNFADVQQKECKSGEGGDDIGGGFGIVDPHCPKAQRQ